MGRNDEHRFYLVEKSVFRRSNPEKELDFFYFDLQEFWTSIETSWNAALPLYIFNTI